jgi:hypothetical protein
MKPTSFRSVGGLIAGFVVATLCALIPASATAASTFELMSISRTGSAANSGSDFSSISADGRLVVFNSDASNLVLDDDNTFRDVFVRDRVTDSTIAISVDTDGHVGNASSYHLGVDSVSDDDRYVLFNSSATNLVEPDDNSFDSDVYLRDLVTGSTERVSVDSMEVQADGPSTGGAISGDGRFVAFASDASNLRTEFGPGSGPVIYLRDRLDDTTTQVTSGGIGFGHGTCPGDMSLSDDGRYLAFCGDSSSIVAGDTNGFEDVFVYDRLTASTERVSVSTAGAQANWFSWEISMSADGRYVSFASPASNLVAGDTNGEQDIFFRDLVTDTTQRLSVGDGEEQGDRQSSWPAMSDDGNVSFWSTSTNWGLGGGPNGAVYLRDIVAGTTTLVASPGGNQSTAVSADASVVAFDDCGCHAGLVPQDTNFFTDVYAAVFAPSDTTPPIVTGTPDRAANGNGWYKAPVTIDWTSEDPDPSSGTPSDPPDTNAGTEGTVTYESDPSCDPANNCATGELELSIDLSNPTVTCNPAAFAVGQSGAAVTASVTDAVSGPIASTVSTPANTTTAGSFSASLTGTDRSGRTTTVSCPYTVGQPHTSTSITSVTNPTTYGQAIQFVATVTNIDTATIPKGKVQFKVDGNNFGNPITLDATGKATTATYSALPAGAHTVTAAFTGQNGTFVDSTSNSLTQTVNAASTSMTLTSSPNPPFWGQSTKFTAKLTNTATSFIPKGSVQFQIDGANSGSPVTLDSTGSAITPYINLTAGTHTVRAVFTGLNGNFSNNERTISQLVKPDVTAVAVSSSKNPSTAGTAVTFTAVVTNSTYGSLKPTGTAQLWVDGAPVGSPATLDAMSRAKFTISTLPVGDHTISVVYTSSDGNFQSSTGTMAKSQTVK